MKQEELIKRINSNIVRYNDIVKTKGKPSYHLEKLSFSSDTGKLKGSYHEFTVGFSDIFSSFPEELKQLWNKISKDVASYQEIYCGKSKLESQIEVLANSISTHINIYNELIAKAKEKGKTKEGYEPISFDYETGFLSNPWHQPFDFVIFGSISYETQSEWKTLEPLLCEYLVKKFGMTDLDILLVKLRWRVEGWNVVCESHKKNENKLFLDETKVELSGLRISISNDIPTLKDEVSIIQDIYNKLRDYSESLQSFGLTSSSLKLQTDSSSEQTDSSNTTTAEVTSAKKVFEIKTKIREIDNRIETVVAKYNKGYSTSKIPDSILVYDASCTILTPGHETFTSVRETILKRDSSNYEKNPGNWGYKAAAIIAQKIFDKSMELREQIEHMMEDKLRLEARIESITKPKKRKENKKEVKPNEGTLYCDDISTGDTNEKSSILTQEDIDYIETYKELVAAGEISPRVRRLLERERESLGITSERAALLEKL